MPSTDDRDYERLAARAGKRRKDLGLALSDASAKAGGVSKGTWRRVEKGLPIRDTNYQKIDSLLEWAVGSCIGVLDGGEPVPVDGVGAAPDVQKSPLPPEVLERERLETVQLALIATAKGTPAEEIREMSERVVRDLRERGLVD